MATFFCSVHTITEAKQ